MADRPGHGWAEIPDGFEVVTEPDPGWRLVAGKRCRYGRPSCKRPSVAEMRRGYVSEQWWAYCGRHLFGRWIENGQVMRWILREKATEDSQ
jgi:hypothetical protein